MKNLNIIISIVIVLAIGATVAAYGIVNPDTNIFSNLGYTPESGSSGSTDGGAGSTDGVGTNNSNNNANNGSNGKESSGTGVKGDKSGSNSGSKSNGGSSGSKSDYGGGMSASRAKSIVNAVEKEFGYHAGSPRWDSGAKLWIVPVLDKEGNKVDSMSVDPKTGKTGRY